MSKNLKITTELSGNREKAEAVKDSLENLSLYLNEIERIINMAPGEATEEEKKYKLQILEQHIADMNDLFRLISGEGKRGNITLS